jgi:G3E family GTPase
MAHCSVDIVTGFLGSGKTTLLSEILDGSLRDEKVAVVMNEIGDIGIDGRTITGMDYVENVVELNSGCICCTIDDYRFDLAINELRDTVDPTLIIIESTGVADPEPVIYRVAQSGLALDAVICVIDADNIDEALKQSTCVKRQIRSADFIVINKVDLVGARRLAGVRRKVKRFNRRALVLECERGQVGTDIAFGTSARRFRAGGGPRGAGIAHSSHLGEDGIESFTYRAEARLDQARFERFLSRLPSKIYRAKGFVRFPDNDWSCLFNFTCGRYELNWIRLTEAAGEAQAVFIGKDLGRMAEKVRAELDGCRTDTV